MSSLSSTIVFGDPHETVTEAAAGSTTLGYRENQRMASRGKEKYSVHLFPSLTLHLSVEVCVVGRGACVDRGTTKSTWMATITPADIMSNRCVYSCSHPLWGGEGTCITTDDSNDEDSCVCDPSYASRDSFGRPSCVPRKVCDHDGEDTRTSKYGVDSSRCCELQINEDCR